nr:MAG: rRNA maturation RNase YbeY [Hyphomicrobiales bacterium]
MRIEDWRWRRNATTLKLIRRATRLALKSVDWTSGTLTLLLTDDAALKDLNRRFCGKPRTTNVLSFPSPDPAYLGDIAIAYEIVAREARAQGKRIKAHAAHLAIHGVLHLAGHDHQNKAEALEMEALEVQILGRLGIPNPYCGIPYPGKGKAA